MQLLLSMPVASQNKVNLLKESGFDDTEINNQLLLTYTIFQKAITGDVKATSIILKTIQNEDNEKTNAFNDALDDLFHIWSVKKARKNKIIKNSKHKNLLFFYQPVISTNSYLETFSVVNPIALYFQVLLAWKLLMLSTAVPNWFPSLS